MEQRTLDEWQYKTLQELIAIPSHTPSGELNKLHYIDNVLEELSSDARFSFKRIPVDGEDPEKDRYVLLIEKRSKQDARKGNEPKYRALLNAHIDTVPPDDDSQQDETMDLEEIMQRLHQVDAQEFLDVMMEGKEQARREFFGETKEEEWERNKRQAKEQGYFRKICGEEEKKKRDIWEDKYILKREGGYLHGLGVYDMQSQVMLQMWLLKNVDVPDGVSVSYAFVPDEEYDSLGAQKLIQWIEENRIQYNSILSSEVEPRHESEVGNIQRIVVARRGVMKVLGEVFVGKRHGALQNAPNALDAHTELKNIYYGDFYRDSEKKDPHPLLGSKSLNTAYCEGDAREEHSRVPIVWFGYKEELVPEGGNDPFSWEKELDEQQAYFDRIVDDKEWPKKGIGLHIWMDTIRTSYPSYEVDRNHPLVRQIAKVAEEVCHPGYPVVVEGAGSNADTNLYAAHLAEQNAALSRGKRTKSVCIDCPPIGDCAHNRGERVAEYSLVQNAEISRRIIEGIFQLLVEKM